MDFSKEIMDNKNFEEILKFFDLEENLPEKEISSIDIATFAFEQCKRFLPDQIKYVFKNCDKNNFFQNDLIFHMLLSVKLKYLFLNNKDYTKNKLDEYKSFCSGMKLPIMGEDSHIITNINKNYLIFLNKIGNKYLIPVFMKNFILYITAKPIIYNKCHWYVGANMVNSNEYKELIYKRSEFPDIEYYLFERTVNIKLFSVMYETLPEEIIKNDSLYKYLSVTSLLPNVNGRIVLMLMFLKNRELLITGNEGISCGDKLTNENLSKTHQELIQFAEIVTKMAVFVIPLMVNCCWYYLSQRPKNMEEILNLDLQEEKTRASERINEMNSINVNFINKLNQIHNPEVYNSLQSVYENYTNNKDLNKEKIKNDNIPFEDLVFDTDISSFFDHLKNELNKLINNNE